MLFKYHSNLKRPAYTLITTALSILILVFYIPAFEWNLLLVLGYALLILGMILIVFRKIFTIIQKTKLRNEKVECQHCSWNGPGLRTLKAKGCPECGSNRIVPRTPQPRNPATRIALQGEEESKDTKRR
jgi:DNA-directed RNA polymerase subunit RPC12/RpoP